MVSPSHGSLNWTPILPVRHETLLVASDTQENVVTILCYALESILFLVLALGTGRASAEALRRGSGSLALGITRPVQHPHFPSQVVLPYSTVTGSTSFSEHSSPSSSS